MPVKIPDALPATKVLQEENIFVMTEQRATAQDIRPLRIAILNLMPTKEITETQLLRLIGNTPIQIEVTLLNTATHKSKNTSSEHLGAFYKHFKEVRHEKFDGLIITGAPIELMEFEQVNYWAELLEVMEWADHNVFSTMYICWAAQAAFHHFYGIDKYKLDAKMFGVFCHEVLERTCKLTRGFDDWFYAPHSRHTGIDVEDVRRCPDLTLLAVSPEAGLYLAQSKNGRRVFVTGHSEYDFDTLDKEYKRDVAKNLPINIPCNYYPGDDPSLPPRVCWRAHSNLLFGNWLNYYVYQETPYDLEAIE